LQAALAADNEEAARQQAEALQQRLAHLPSKLTEAEDERRAELAPDIKAAKDEIAGLQGQLAAERAKAAAAQREASDIAARLETVCRIQGGRAAGSGSVHIG
jgi:chromosome segregation ATPase